MRRLAGSLEVGALVVGPLVVGPLVVGPLVVGTLLAGMMLVGMMQPAHAQREQFETSAAWVEMFGEMKAEHPWVRRAQAVFERVADAAYQRRNRPPKLIVLERSPQGDRPFAASLRDGSVLISRNALELSYRSLDPRRGDARAAFLFGHELAHLAGEDLQSLRGFGGNETVTEAVLQQEQRADRQGLLFMTMAGFDPAVVLDQDAVIFSQWMAEDERHGTPSSTSSDGSRLANRRAEALLNSRVQVVDALDFFHAGVRLLQVGQYELALEFLQSFNEVFPGREVLNNLGLAHYQLALRHLSRCDAALTTRYRLPAVVDDATLASKFRRRAAQAASPCLENRSYRQQAETAREYLEQALEVDPSYLPARLNLLSLLLVERDSRAMSVAAEGLKDAPDQLRLLWLQDLAKAQMAATLDVPSLARESVDSLQRLRARFPRDVELAYNHAALLTQLGDPAAQKAWRDFLELEARGPWADVARLCVSQGEGKGSDPDDASTTHVRSLAALRAEGLLNEGALGSSLDRPLQRAPSDAAGSTSKSFRLGSIDGAFHRQTDGVRVLEVDQRLVLVEAPWPESLESAKIKNRLAAPRRQLLTPAGEVWVFDDFALEWSQGRGGRIIGFSVERNSSGV